MKKVFYVISYFSILFFLIVLSCSNNDTTSTEDNSITVSSQGGLFVLPNGIELNVPVGALDSNTVITVESITTSNVASELASSKHTGDTIIAGISALPEGLSFNVPVTITMSMAQITNPDKILLHAITEAGQLKFISTNVLLDPANDKLSLEISSFSKHYVVEVENQAWLATFDPATDWDQCKNWNGVDGSDVPVGTLTVEDDCRCGRRRYTSEDMEYVNSEGCQSLRSLLNIEFVDCSTPTYWMHYVTEEIDCNGNAQPYLATSNGEGFFCKDYGIHHKDICSGSFNYREEPCPAMMTDSGYNHVIVCKKELPDNECSPPVAINPPGTIIMFYYFDDANYAIYKDTLCTGAGETLIRKE